MIYLHCISPFHPLIFLPLSLSSTPSLPLPPSLFHILSSVCSAGLSPLYFLCRAGDYSSTWDSGDSLVRLFIISDLFASTLPFALSVIYHTFMPHKAGVRLYKNLLKADVFGVWFANTFGPLCGIYVSVYCLSILREGILVSHLLLSLVVLYYLVVVDCKRQRVVALMVQFCFRSLVLLLRLTPLVTAPLTALYYYLLMSIVSSVGALINALHIPECWFPGKCDYCLNGHSLMHIAAFLTIAVGRNASLIDLAWLASRPSCSL